MPETKRQQKEVPRCEHILFENKTLCPRCFSREIKIKTLSEVGRLWARQVRQMFSPGIMGTPGKGRRKNAKKTFVEFVEYRDQLEKMFRIDVLGSLVF